MMGVAVFLLEGMFFIGASEMPATVLPDSFFLIQSSKLPPAAGLPATGIRHDCLDGV
jgi:hypothetical protein